MSLPAKTKDRSTADFESWYGDKKVRLARIFLPVAILLYVVFIPWDLAMAPQVAPTTFVIRMALCTVLALLWFLVPSPFMRRWHDWVMSLGVVIAGLGTSVILALIPGGFGAASGGIAMSIMFAGGAIRLPAAYTAAATGGVTMVALVVMQAVGEPPNVIVSKAMTLGGLSALAVLYNAWFRADALAIFRYEQQLKSEKEQSELLLETVTTMREQRVMWLENFAGFLRHELKNQVAGMATSLDMADKSQPGEPSQRYVERARRSLGSMRRLIESASEATTLEGALSAEHMALLDLSAVVGERVVDFRQTHPARRLRVDIEPYVTIRGNEDRLAQLVDKLLGNAAEHCEHDGEIRVTLRHENEIAVLRVENDGDLLPVNQERLFDAFFTTGKNSAGPPNLGLGLFVAKVIVESHAGKISAENLERKGVGVSVHLPASRAGLWS